MNKVILIGNVCKDIVYRKTTNDKDMARFTLAVTRKRKNQNGEYESDFINCLSYGATAKLLNDYVKKGDKISVEGEIRTGSYVNNEGQKIYTTDVMVLNIGFLTPKKDPYQEFSDEMLLD